MALVIDLNADVGESFGQWRLGDDEALLSLVSSANVACGFHAGDPSTLRRTCDLAAASSVAIGAQVAYPDLAGFGRRFIDVSPEALRDDVLYQLGALEAFARAAGSRVAYVKPHGALYNAVVHHDDQARAVAEAVAEFGGSLPVLGLPGSRLLAHVADRGLRAVPEAFADRAYAPDGTLVPRDRPGAVITDPSEVAARAVRMVLDGQVLAADGGTVRLHAESICVHGDTTGAVDLAVAVRRALATAGVQIGAFG